MRPAPATALARVRALGSPRRSASERARAARAASPAVSLWRARAGRECRAGGSGAAIGAEKSAPARAISRSPSCSRSTRVLTSSIAPAREIAELERPERHADQAVHRQPEMTEHVLHLAVLALADGEGEPHVRSLLAVERGLDRPVADAVDGDAGAQPVELRPAARGRGRARDSAAASRSPAAPARARGRRRW